MKRNLKVGISATALIGLLLASSQPAFADDPLLDSQQTIRDLTTVRPTSSAPVPRPIATKQPSAANSIMSTNSVGYGRAKLYSGNWMLFTEMNVDFYFDWSRVVLSYGYQNVGALGLNTVQALGIQCSYSSTWQHSWRAMTDVGVGSATPWGNVNIYHRTLVQGANVYGDGAWYAWQEN